MLLSVYAKGSYPNNTNVRQESDVDIGVQCHDVFYWDAKEPDAHPASEPYTGIWTPAKLRSEVKVALEAKFPGSVDSSGPTAITVHSGTTRVDADIVPCFDYRYYFASGGQNDGARIFRVNGGAIENFPVQHLEEGRTKNNRTNLNFKKAVRVLKRVNYAMVADGKHREVPSFFIECLVCNCPDGIFSQSTWTDRVKGILVHIYNALEGDEPASQDERWLQVDRCQFLFFPSQKWTRADGRDFAAAAWNYLDLGS